MEPLYQPQGIEERWQRTWEDEGLYNAEPGSGRETVCHRAPAAERDRRAAHRARAAALGRGRARPLAPDARVRDGFPDRATTTRASRRRPRSRSTWPREGKTRQDVGREKFVELVWDWLREYGGTIMEQFRRMGASMDYRRERFTMDDEYSRAVMRFFVHLLRQGLDLPREPDHQLVPVPRDVALRPRARAREVDDALT